MVYLSNKILYLSENKFITATYIIWINLKIIVQSKNQVQMNS